MSLPTSSDASPISFDQPSPEEIELQKSKLSLLFDTYKHKFTTFPKDNGWIVDNLYMYQGFWLMSNTSFSIQTVMAAQDTFQAHPNDIYLVTLPKSGTTWLKALVFAIMNRNRYKNTHPLLISNPHLCVPFVEEECLRTNPFYRDANYSPRLFATHIPYTSLPQSILDSNCRILYMCRNPKDVLVSLFHFINKVRSKSRGVMTIEEAFNMFSNGVNPYGPYWDHVKAYYKLSLEHPTRVLFLTYENMKLDIANNVKRIAEFLGFPFTEDENAKGAVEEIASLCSFEKLSEVNKHGNYLYGVPNNIFFREGKVGDWRNHLTSEMSQVLDQITKEKFNGLDISF